MPRRSRHSEVQPQDQQPQEHTSGRKRRKNEQDQVQVVPVPDPEREQEAWDEFAADYYESELISLGCVELSLLNTRISALAKRLDLCLTEREVLNVMEGDQGYQGYQAVG